LNDGQLSSLNLTEWGYKCRSVCWTVMHTSASTTSA